MPLADLFKSLIIPVRWIHFVSDGSDEPLNITFPIGRKRRNEDDATRDRIIPGVCLINVHVCKVLTSGHDSVCCGFRSQRINSESLTSLLSLVSE